ncbi:phage terminase small subunit P27 family [Dyadobacter fermentans]|uniref:phage terminase small subunit P27 family n=1 Tax=Dyadobacter fermentans TaxID=94254 RepID=UPI001CBD4795|nr:phage terminase small subunit P27 family [Dyadobacter fermentans]MBZ1362148.1 phage terminase small subunit P27 family [Dyadobacter fermentans]
MAGRPAKPTNQKIIDGTFRVDRAVENEMMPSTLESAPTAPKELSKAAKLEWDSVCQELLRLKMLHRVDLGLLAAYCIEMSTYLEETKKIKREGSVITIQGKMGEYKMPNPRVAIKNASLKNAQALANQFGFTPSARARINVPAGETESALQKLLKAKMERNKRLKNGDQQD